MPGRFTRILVPTDFGPASDAALACAKELALRFDAAVHLLHVVDDPLAAGVWTPEVYVGASAETREKLMDDAALRLKDSFTDDERKRFSTAAEVRVGAPSETIVEFALEKGIDLIVMGTHGRRGFAHMFVGSVAERLVRTAPCPVLTVRAGRQAEPVAEVLQAAEA
jgi:nucleotide-binding universal stress UspA family protein